MKLPTLHTHNIILRPLRPEDASAMFAYAHNVRTTQFTRWRSHTTLNDSRQFIAAVLDKELLMWAIVLSDSQRVVGECAVHVYTTYTEIECALLPEYWGQGIAYAALKELIDFSFQMLGIHHVQASIVSSNVRSIRLAQKLGLSKTTTLTNQWLIGTTLHDVEIFTLSRSL
jgi:ribosomal-protein-alanine N-acetyltransferase